MEIATLERPGTADRTSARTSSARRGAVRTSGGAGRAVGVPAATARGSRWAVAGGVLAVLATGLWSLSAVPGAVSPAGPGELGLVGGVVRVDAVVSAARPQQAMPGMGADNDPVAEDERRVSVDVTLRADEDSTLEYVAQRFRLTPDGGAAQAPHKLMLAGEELPPGTALSGTLIFDVPKDARSATLAYDESSTDVTLPAETGGGTPAAGDAASPATHGAGHG